MLTDASERLLLGYGAQFAPRGRSSLVPRFGRSLVSRSHSVLGFVVHAKNLFVEAKPPGRGKCAARKDLLSGHQAIDGGSLLLNCRSSHRLNTQPRIPRSQEGVGDHNSSVGNPGLRVRISFH